MLAEQKKLVAKLRSAERDATELYNSGVKIMPVVQKIRAATDELESRVRFIEKESKRSAAPAPSNPKPNTKSEPET